MWRINAAKHEHPGLDLVARSMPETGEANQLTFSFGQA
jgi:hypothetical protein